MHILGFEIRRYEITENVISIELYNSEDAEELFKDLLEDE